VINLSLDKRKVFEEAFRVLKPGGRLMISDIVLLKELPEVVKESVEAYIGCLSGAMMKEEYLQEIEAADFQEIKVVDETHFPLEDMANDPTAKAIADKLTLPSEKVREIANSVASVKVHAIKPTGSV